MEYFSSLFSGGFSLPYELGEKYGSAWGKWDHYQAARTSDKKPFSLFKLTAAPDEALLLEAARNGIKRIRTVRPPASLLSMPAHCFEHRGADARGDNAVARVTRCWLERDPGMIVWQSVTYMHVRAFCVLVGECSVPHRLCCILPTAPSLHGPHVVLTGYAVSCAHVDAAAAPQTKHPRVLAFEWAGEQDAGGGARTLWLATEPAQPLRTLLQAELAALEAGEREAVLALFLRQVAQAVAFLTNTCKLVHGNVCLDAVLVTPELDCKLGYFDVASEHAHLASSLLARCACLALPWMHDALQAH